MKSTKFLYHALMIKYKSEQLFVSFFCFSLCKMVDSENSPDNYKMLKISIGGIIKDPKMLKFVLDHLRTKKVCENAVKMLFL